MEPSARHALAADPTLFPWDWRNHLANRLVVRQTVDPDTGAAGWDGAAASWTMIDPHSRLSAFFAMHVKNFGYSYDVIHPEIRTLIYGGLNQ